MLRHRPHGRRSALGRSKWWPWPHQTGVATELGAPHGRPGLSDPLQARVLPNRPILLTLAASRSGSATVNRQSYPGDPPPGWRNQIGDRLGYVVWVHIRVTLKVNTVKTVNGIDSISVGTSETRATNQVCNRYSRHANGRRIMQPNVSIAIAKKPPSPRNGFATIWVDTT